MDGLELGVDDGHLREHGEVISTSERHDVVHQAGHSLVLRRDEGGTDRAAGAPADPHWLGAPVPWCVVRAVHEHPVHLADGVGGELVGECERGLHRPGVPHDLGGVPFAGVADLGGEDGTGAGGEMFDLGGRGRL
nr:hypothetical protein [Agromyces humatus]